ncbi:helix-turn-helix transcriptional regulator, partial [Streptomyces sp. NPDC002812]|uniref:heat shock protein transcriptional repressor HspR n=1 Tax=Streptomyces sp. NPDC002812 TaxID=3154434 RepID=UPI0033206EFE
MDGRRRNPYELTEDTPVYVISVAAQLSGLHPQTLRQYDRLGLVSPDRTAGRGRRYSARDIELLRQVQQLSQNEGINLAGIKRIIELENQVSARRRDRPPQGPMDTPGRSPPAIAASRDRRAGSS